MVSDTKTLKENLGVDLNLTSKFDSEAVEVVAGLLTRIDEARADIAARGVVVDGRENPACLTERTASAELRGWVKERPDLFGARGHQAVTGSSESLKGKFKVV